MSPETTLGNYQTPMEIAIFYRLLSRDI